MVEMRDSWPIVLGVVLQYVTNAQQRFIVKTVLMSMYVQNYAITLANQLGKHSTNRVLGLKLTDETLNSLREDQVGQLYQLFQETQKPLNPDNPVGENPFQVPTNTQ
jgi:hypothetical protein